MLIWWTGEASVGAEHTQACTLAYIRAYTYSTYIHRHPHSLIHSLTHSLTHTCTYACMQAQLYAHTYSRMHAHVQAHTYSLLVTPTDQRMHTLITMDAMIIKLVCELIHSSRMNLTNWDMYDKWWELEKKLYKLEGACASTVYEWK